LGQECCSRIEAFKIIYSHEQSYSKKERRHLVNDRNLFHRKGRLLRLFAGVRESIPRPEDGRLGATRVRPGGGGIQILTGHREQPVLCDIGREWRWQDRDHQVHPTVPMLGY